MTATTVAASPDLDQRAAIAFLADPANYGPGCGVVERIDTHCSIVFLAGDHAYKLKRAIRYASLDYTTRACRHAACAAEVTLNRRTAPDLYQGCLSIMRGTDGVLRFDGPGEAIDWVVVMTRFDQADLFDRMLSDDRLESVHMRTVGAAVARLHENAEITPQFGGSDTIRAVIAENTHELALVATELDGAAVGQLAGRAAASLDSLAALLDRRRLLGKVRRGHGDLRLANICLFRGVPTLFDAIEFSETIGCIDRLYDLAFLLMDLCLHQRHDFANVVFNAYLDAIDETEGLRCLPLFLALRSATRAYGLAGKANRTADGDESRHMRALAHRHIEAGLDFLVPSVPQVVLFESARGESEAIATDLAANAAPAPGARILHADADDRVWFRVDAILRAGISVLLLCPPGGSGSAARARRLADHHRVPFARHAAQ